MDICKRSEKYFSKKKSSKLWPNMVMAKNVIHTFSRASAILVRQMEIFHMSLVHPVGNCGPNYGKYAGHLMGENGHQSQKWPNLTTKLAIIQKSLLDISLPWEYCLKNIRLIWYKFDTFCEIIFSVQGLGQKKITVDKMSPVE